MTVDLKKIGKWLSAGAAAVAILGAVTGFLAWSGLRPTVQFELAALAAEVTTNSIDIAEDKIDRATERLYRNIREQENYKIQNQQVPAYLVDERSLLENKIRKLERRIQELSSTKAKE